jgi:uncharacterized protein YjbI with pentapeptide repeats
LSPLLLVSPSPAHADIFQWEYINPADPSQGKRQSTTLAPDGAGVNAVPGVNLYRRDLTMAYLIGADLQNADFRGATLTDADFTGAEVQGANFFSYFNPSCYPCGPIFVPGITLAQLYSTASYHAGDLTGIKFAYNDLANGNFAGQNLTNATFYSATLTHAVFSGANLTNAILSRDDTLEQTIDLTGANFRQANLTNAIFIGATLTDADFSGAEVRGANLSKKSYSTGITLAQLYSTASYKAKDLREIGLSANNLAGANFADQNLTHSVFSYATLTAADFRQANITNAHFGGANLTGAKFTGQNLSNLNFSGATLRDADLTGAQVRGANFGNTGITLAQLYSTASYEAKDLSGIDLELNSLEGGNFAGQNLTNANLFHATVTGAEFTGAEVRGASLYGITLAQLYSTASYQAHDLSGIRVSGDLGGGNFAGQNLANASLGGILTGADFTGAEVRGASLSGITLAQLYSTASYQAHDLIGIILSGDLSGGNFARQNLKNANFGTANLTGANFREANLTNTNFGFYFCIQTYGLGCGWVYATVTNADLTAADARGALTLEGSNLSGATTANLIWPDGHIDGLDLDAGALLVIRDYDGSIPITIDQHLAMGPGGTLRMVFEADAWDSTISFAPGIPVTLGGTVELTFAADVNLASQIGRTFDLFDWTGVTPSGAFAISSPYTWNLSNLYTSGEVTLTAIPEPSSLFLLTFALAAIGQMRISFDSRNGDN